MWDQDEVVRGGNSAADLMNTRTGLTDMYRRRSSWTWQR